MTPAEVFSLIELNRPKEINGVHEDDYDEMLSRMQKLEEEGVDVI